jgi:hypothetical protein
MDGTRTHTLGERCYPTIRSTPTRRKRRAGQRHVKYPLRVGLVDGRLPAGKRQILVRSNPPVELPLVDTAIDLRPPFKLSNARSKAMTTTPARALHGDIATREDVRTDFGDPPRAHVAEGPLHFV